MQQDHTYYILTIFLFLHMA